MRSVGMDSLKEQATAKPVHTLVRQLEGEALQIVFGRNRFSCVMVQ